MKPRKSPGAGREPRDRESPPEDFGSYPVLLVPGWGAPKWHTDWIARHLEREGLDVYKLVLPRMAVGDMVASAGLVERRVDQILSARGVDRVSLVGYSLGGLIVRIYLEYLDGYKRLGRAAYVGAPQEGIYTGYAASFTKAGRQVRRGSSFMRELNMERRCACGQARCLAVFLSRDGTILPSKSARLSCGYNLELVWPVLHWGLVFNREVIHAVAAFLKGAIPEGAVEVAGKSPDAGKKGRQG